MSNLQILSLKKTGICDKDISFIAPLGNIHVLELQGTHITSSGLSHLEGEHYELFHHIGYIIH